MNESFIWLNAKQYSYPIIIFNLTKKADNREWSLSDQYKYAIDEALNGVLPEDK